MRRLLPRIVLSGGPKAGKSTLVELVRAEFPGTVCIFPEMATFLQTHFGIEVPAPGSDEHRLYNTRLTHAQVVLEDMVDAHAAAMGYAAVLADRGIVDNAAYLLGGIEEFERQTGIRFADALARYDLPIVLEIAPRDVFEDPRFGENKARKETYDQGSALDLRTRGVWAPHPRYRFHGNDLGWDGKVNGGMSDIRSFVASL